MLTLDLARQLKARLRAAGRGWEPAPGDRFLIPDRDMDEEVFVVSDMTIEVAEHPTGRQIRFNGTTEWALDSIPAAEVFWLPWEHQLRCLLTDRFSRLEQLEEIADAAFGSATIPGGYVVVLTDGSRHVASAPDAAYARALLAVL